MKKLSLIIILSIIVKISTGQSIFECGTLDDTSLKSATCNDWNNYAAVDPINTPIDTVRLTFHIMQKKTGNEPAARNMHYLSQPLVPICNWHFLA